MSVSGDDNKFVVRRPERVKPIPRLVHPERVHLHRRCATSVPPCSPHVARSPWRASKARTPKERQWPRPQPEVRRRQRHIATLALASGFRLATRLRAHESNVAGERRPTQQKGGQVRKEWPRSPDWEESHEERRPRM